MDQWDQVEPPYITLNPNINFSPPRHGPLGPRQAPSEPDRAAETVFLAGS